MSIYTEFLLFFPSNFQFIFYLYYVELDVSDVDLSVITVSPVSLGLGMFN